MMPPMNRKKLFTGILVAAIFLSALLSIPAPGPPLEEGVAGKPFTWKQDATWNALEASFRQARSIGCAGLMEPIEEGFRRGRQYLTSLAASPFGPDAAIFTEPERNIFSLGTMVAACPERLKDYIDLVTGTRSLLKRRSENWDMNDLAARDRRDRGLAAYI